MSHSVDVPARIGREGQPGRELAQELEMLAASRGWLAGSTPGFTFGPRVLAVCANVIVAARQRSAPLRHLLVRNVMSSVRRGVYGSVVIPRGLCPDCSEWAFILRGRFQCCDRPTSEDGAARARFERMCESGYRRQKPGREQQAEILSSQANRCFYCGSAFGDAAYRDGKAAAQVLRPCWDHVEPFSWQANNQLLNFVAACAVCNGIKSNLMFETKELARLYVWRRRKIKGWSSATELKPEARNDAA